MKLDLVVKASAKTKTLAKTNDKVEFLSSFLKTVPKSEGKLTVGLLLGENPYGKIGIGWVTLKESLPTNYSTKSEVEIKDLDSTLNQLALIKGKESTKARLEILTNFFSRITKEEANFLFDFFIGEIRQGAGKGILIKALAKAFGIDQAELERIALFYGNFLDLVDKLYQYGGKIARSLGFQIFTPIQPMLAENCETVREVFDLAPGRWAFEYKLDGARLQIHKQGEQIKIFSRHLKDITHKLPEVVELVKNHMPESIVLEAEGVILDKNGKTIPFQNFMRRFGKKNFAPPTHLVTPLFFDILYFDSHPLIDLPYEERYRILRTVAGKNLIDRTVTDNEQQAEAFLKQAVALGNEGLMAKRLDAPYLLGSRGKGWLKLKPYETLDLVITAADWGHGRRTGWLSNYHLAAYDKKTGNFLPLGKTFKGLTDEELARITKALQEIKIAQDKYTVYVQPKIVVEVAFNDIQVSPFYASGFALRFARIKKIRFDKSVPEANTLDDVIRIYEQQQARKGKI
ncbi:MAG: ATP-dependent DNA ligase [candidate division WOR-3 bacterium]